MIIVDLETSGLNYEKSGIWQIGAYDLETGNKFLEEARIDNEDIISDESLLVTGKTKEYLRNKNKQNQKQPLENFFNWCNKMNVGNILCQNPQFDFPLLKLRADRYELRLPFHHRCFDLHTTAQLKYFELYDDFLLNENHSDMGLSNILNFVGIEDQRRRIKNKMIIKQGNEHNALEDAELTAECFYRLIYGRNLLDKYKEFKIPDILRR